MVERKARGHPEPDWVKEALAQGAPRIVVTYRGHEIVSEALRLPESGFFPNTSLLSVGEGLSDFVEHISKEKYVNAIALDPIYLLGRRRLRKRPEEINKALVSVFGWNVGIKRTIMEFKTTFPETISFPKIKCLVAGTVYQLPFPSETFDFVVSHELFRYINLALALPEMLRVLKPNGEIRFGGCSLMTDGTKLYKGCFRETYPTRYHAEFDERVLVFQENVGFQRAMEWLGSKATVYAFINRFQEDGSGAERIFTDYSVAPLIIRTDTSLPMVQLFTGREMEEIKKHGDARPLVGGLFEVNTQQLKTDQRRKGVYGPTPSYYEMEMVR